MWLENCSDEESMTLIAIAALAASLPRGLADYADAITQINRKYFSLPARRLNSHNPSRGSLAQTHNVRATRQWK